MNHIGLAHRIASDFVPPGHCVEDSEFFAEALIELWKAEEEGLPRKKLPIRIKNRLKSYWIEQRGQQYGIKREATKKALEFLKYKDEHGQWPPNTGKYNGPYHATIRAALLISTPVRHYEEER